MATPVPITRQPGHTCIVTWLRDWLPVMDAEVARRHAEPQSADEDQALVACLVSAVEDARVYGVDAAALAPAQHARARMHREGEHCPPLAPCAKCLVHSGARVQSLVEEHDRRCAERAVKR